MNLRKLIQHCEPLELIGLVSQYRDRFILHYTQQTEVALFEHRTEAHSRKGERVSRNGTPTVGEVINLNVDSEDASESVEDVVV